MKNFIIGLLVGFFGGLFVFGATLNSNLPYWSKALELLDKACNK